MSRDSAVFFSLSFRARDKMAADSVDSASASLN